jgi:hypothetical protein
MLRENCFSESSKTCIGEGDGDCGHDCAYGHREDVRDVLCFVCHNVYAYVCVCACLRMYVFNLRKLVNERARVLLRVIFMTTMPRNDHYSLFSQ